MASVFVDCVSDYSTDTFIVIPEAMPSFEILTNMSFI